jgi:hypothetical protein
MTRLRRYFLMDISLAVLSACGGRVPEKFLGRSLGFNWSRFQNAYAGFIVWLSGIHRHDDPYYHYFNRPNRTGLGFGAVALGCSAGINRETRQADYFDSLSGYFCDVTVGR